MPASCTKAFYRLVGSLIVIENELGQDTYDNNANSVWFDECMLTFDETGTAYTYDEDGNVISAADNANRNATYSYSDAKELTGATNSNNESYSYTYSTTNKHRLVAARSNQLGSGFTYSYDSFGNIIGTKMGTVSTAGNLDTDALYIESGSSYDATGNYVTAVTDQRGNATTYDINTTSGLTNSITDPSGATTSYTYEDGSWLPLSISSGDSSVSYSYDAYNRLTQIQHNGFTYHFAYDKFGNTSTVKVGDQTLMTNTYGEGNGLLLSETYGNGTVYAYTYDEYGRVIKVSINGTDRYATVYNAKGQIAEIKDLVNNEKTVYTYDISGRLLKISQSGGKSISTGYDILNRVTAINYQFAGQTKTVSFGYGQDGQKGESTLLSGATQTATYDTLGRETASTVGDLTRSVSYLNVSGNRTTTLPETLNYKYNGTTLLETEYAYDTRGNISQMTVDGVTYTYTYDSLNQLTGVTGTNGYSASYIYDNGGNIDYKIINGVTTDYEYDTDWKDKLIKYNGHDIDYDEMGNPTDNYLGELTWEGRKLLSIKKTDNTVINYTYNASGIRTKKTVGSNTTEYFLDGSTILAEKNGSNVIWYIYDTGGELLGFTYNGTPYYYLKNQQGDVYKIVDTNGTVVGSYTYDPWGKVIADGTMAEINPIRYRSYYYDSETQLYYLQSRYYDPELGRFVNADGLVSTGQGLIGNNMFAYCLNNPTNTVDPTGTIGWEIIIPIIIGLIPLLSGCEDNTESYGAAGAYEYSSSPKYNCYAHALGLDEWKYVGGSPDAVKDFSVDKVGDMVEADILSMGWSIRPLESYDSPIGENEFRIALATGPSDYHFMVQHSDGTWSHKPGFGPTRQINGDNPSCVSWDMPIVNTQLLSMGIYREVAVYEGYYNDGPVYYAISKGG